MSGAPGDSVPLRAPASRCLADLFIERALGVRIETLALRYAMSEAQVRAIFEQWGEPARLQPRRWHQVRTQSAAGTFAARTASSLE